MLTRADFRMKSSIGALLAAVVIAGAAGCTDTAPPAPGPTQPDNAAQPLRARAAHTATLLADGRVLLAGGCAVDGCTTAGVAPSSEFYLPGHGFEPGPSMRFPRDGHTATALADGRVLIVGGWTAEGTLPLAEAELFDPKTNAFIPAGTLRVGRGAHIAAPLPDGRVLIAGGGVGRRSYTASVEIFEPATSTFQPGPAMPQARQGAVAIALRD